MKKNALVKDFFMEIKKTRNRFLSIFLIVALGVAFFAGVRAAAPDMRLSADLLYDNSNFMDIRVLGGLGITAEDVEAVRGISGVEYVQGGYSADVLCNASEAQLVVRMMSVTESINKITVTDGRMPEKADECLADERFLSLSGYKIGDTITVKSGTDDDIKDTLKETEFKIVGMGRTAYYLSLDRGTSKIGNGELSSFLMVPEESFSLDVFTEAVIRVSGAKDYVSASEEYEDVVEKVTKRLEDISHARCEIRYEAVYHDGTQELADARTEIEDNKKKLEDAERDLEDGERELTDGEKELEENKVKLADAEKEISDGEKQLSEGRQQISDGEKQIAEGWDACHENTATLEEKKKELADARIQAADGEAQLTSGKKELESQESVLAAGRGELEAGKQQLSEGKQQLTEGITQVQSGIIEVRDNLQQIEENLPVVESGITQIQEGLGQIEGQKAVLQQQLAGHQENLAVLESQLENALPEERPALEENIALLLAAIQQIQAGISQAEEQENSLNAQLGELSAQKARMEEMLPLLQEQNQSLPIKLQELEAQLDELSKQERVLAAKEGELSEGEAQITQAKALLTEKEQELSHAWSQIADGEIQIGEGENQLYEARELLVTKGQELEEARDKIRSSEEELRKGKAELEDGRQQIEDGEAKLADGRKELEEGRQEYEDKKKEADEKIEDAEQKLADGQKELDELEVPKWYVLDRDAIQTYVEYEQDADRVKAIGDVFPAIFFLVAALICLTTMTRMVEEERTQIGTLKALGYNKFSIAAKYLCYALTASLGGSLIGLVVGQKVLPPVIINAYGILYNNLPEVAAPLHLGYSVSSTLLAIACTTVAAGVACFKEMVSTPARLMRPAAPKSGKRVLLERVGIIWNHLSFTNKSTVRNLFRYKKRFFMTVLGIGGCMGLLLVGFGLKDSIRSIGTIQYNDLMSYHSEIVLEEKSSQSEREEVLEAIKQDKNIESFLPVYKTSLDIQNEKEKITKSAYVMVPENTEKFTEFVDLRGRLTNEHYNLSDEGIVLSEKLAKLLDVKEGDTVILKEEEKDRYEVKISHITENYFMHYIYISPGLYEKVFGERPEFVDYLTMNASKDSAFEEAMQKKYMDYDQISQVSFITKTADRIANMLKSMDTIIYVLVIAAGLLAFVVLYNLNNINISERIRELATLKVLGFYDMEVSRYVLRENICLTVIGSILGIFFGKTLHRFVILTAETDIMMFGRDILPVSFLYSILLTFFFSAVVNFFMHFHLKKVDMVESMKSVE